MKKILFTTAFMIPLVLYANDWKDRSKKALRLGTEWAIAVSLIKFSNEKTAEIISLESFGETIGTYLSTRSKKTIFLSSLACYGVGMCVTNLDLAVLKDHSLYLGIPLGTAGFTLMGEFMRRFTNQPNDMDLEVELQHKMAENNDLKRKFPVLETPKFDLKEVVVQK